MAKKKFKIGDRVRGNAAALERFPTLDLRGEVRREFDDGTFLVTIGHTTHIVHPKWLEKDQ